MDSCRRQTPIPGKRGGKSAPSVKNIVLIASSLLLLATLSTHALAQAQPEFLSETSIRGPVDDEGPLSEPRHIAFGMNPDGVVNAMKGKPDGKLAPDIWVYWNFRSAFNSETPRFDTLIVFFSSERVFKYRLVEKQAVLALLAQARKGSKAPPSVAKK